jgi:hypothetical protein
MKLLKTVRQGLQIEIDKTDLALLDGALERSIDDVEHYLKHGNPEDDIQDEGALAYVQALPDEYLRLRYRIEDLQRHADEPPWYTVVLIYPDYIATQYGEDYYINAAQAAFPETAVEMVQELARDANHEECLAAEDFAVVAVFPGDLTPELTRNDQP